jgi:HEAT repeat protein
MFSYRSDITAVQNSSFKALSKSYFGQITAFLKDKSFAIRLSAVKALRKIGDKTVIPILKKALNDEHDSYIIDEYKKTISFLEAKFDI